MRIRSIKPEFWRSDDIDALSVEDRLLFIGMWSYVDDSGVGVDKESAIAADLFAGDLSRDFMETSLRVQGGLKRLHAAGLIERYEVGSRRFIHIVSFGKHQKINRPTPSRYPPPTSGNILPPDPDVSPHGELSEGSLRARMEQGSRGAGEQGKKNLSSAKPPRQDVDQLCAHLANRIEANTGKRPTVTQRWRDSARLLLDKDLANESDPLALATRLVDWATNDEFWRTNVLSMPTFRDKFTQLRLKARREWEQTNRRPPTYRTSEAVASVDVAFDEWETRHSLGGNVLALPTAHPEIGA